MSKKDIALFILIYSLCLYVDKSLTIILIFVYATKYTKYKPNYFLYVLSLIFIYPIELNYLLKGVIFFVFVVILEIIYRREAILFLQNYWIDALFYASIFSYSFLKFDIQAYFMKSNTDIQVWMINAFRLSEFNSSTFNLNWDNKGPLISNLYKYISTFNLFESVWHDLTFFYFLFLLIMLIIIKKNLQEYFLNKNVIAINLSIFVLFLDFVNQDTAAYTTFDARFLTVFLNILAIYFYQKSKFKISVFLFFLNYLNLISNLLVFLVFQFLNLLFFLQKKRQIISNLLIYFSLIFLHMIWLLYTDQLESFYLNNILFNSRLDGNYFDLNILKIVYDNLFFTIPSLIFILYLIKNRNQLEFNYKAIVFLVLISESIHLVLTGPRFYHYNVLIIPYIYIATLIFLVEIEKKVRIQFSMVFIIVFLITGVLSNNNFLPNKLTSERQFTHTFDAKNIYFNLNSLNISTDTRINTLVKISKNQKKQRALVLANSDEYDYIFNKLNLLPTTRLWSPIYHRDEFFNSNRLYDSEDFIKILNDDLSKEKPKVFLMSQNNKELRKSIIYDYFNSNLVRTECIEKFCFYERKK